MKGVSLGSKGNSGLYILNAWVSENRFCIGQENVEKKSNEITAIPNVIFKEDACRAKVGESPVNLSTIRKFALQLLSNQKDKLSLKKRQYKAALDIEYLKKMINF